MAVTQETQSVLSKETTLEMYWTMLLARRLDERAWVLHRQGKIAFHISGIGHEAAQVGAAFALRRGSDWFVPYYRDLAMLLALGMTPEEFMLGLMGKKDEPNSGARQMPSHWSLRRANVVSHSSPVSTQTTHAAGIGLAMKLRGDDGVASDFGWGGRHLAGRMVRRRQLGRHPQAAGDLLRREQQLRHLGAPGAPDGGQQRGRQGQRAGPGRGQRRRIWTSTRCTAW